MPSSHCRCLPDCHCPGASAGVQGPAGWADGMKGHRIFALLEHHQSCDQLNSVGVLGTCWWIKPFSDCLKEARNLSSWLSFPFLCFVQISLPVVVQLHFRYVKDFFLLNSRSLKCWKHLCEIPFIWYSEQILKIVPQAITFPPSSPLGVLSLSPELAKEGKEDTGTGNAWNSCLPNKSQMWSGQDTVIKAPPSISAGMLRRKDHTCNSSIKQVWFFPGKQIQARMRT